MFGPSFRNDLEIAWSFTMKLSQGFTRATPTAITILAMVASFALLSISMKTLLATAYTVWLAQARSTPGLSFA